MSGIQRWTDYGEDNLDEHPEGEFVRYADHLAEVERITAERYPRAMTPTRVQLRRTKGWRMPENAIKVDRATRFGNPFRYLDKSSGLVRYGPKHLERFGRAWDYEGRISAHGASHVLWFAADDVVETYVRWATRAELVELFRLTLTEPTPGMRAAHPSRDGHFATVTVDDIRRELAGKNLACWCPLDEPCHADVLLEIANGGAS